MDIELAKLLCELDSRFILHEDYTPQYHNDPTTTAVYCKHLMYIPNVLFNHTEYFMKDSGYGLFFGEELNYEIHPLTGYYVY